MKNNKGKTISFNEYNPIDNPKEYKRERWAKMKWYEKIWDVIEDIYYTIIPWWMRRIDIDREILYFCQRGVRGYSDRDVWGFDGYLADVISGGVEKLYDIHHGMPIDIRDKHKNDEDADKEWKEILGKIASAFAMHSEMVAGDLHPPCSTRLKKALIKIAKKHGGEPAVFMSRMDMKRVKEGKQLFIKYFGSLWD